MPSKKIFLLVGGLAALLILGIGYSVVQSYLASKALDSSIVKLENSPEPAQTGKVTVNVRGFKFSPQVIKVKKGTTVVWTNEDLSNHTITSDTGQELASPLISKDHTLSHTFSTPGVYRYHCKPHPYMIAAVIVVDN